MTESEKKMIKRNYDHVWSLPRGTETICPMCAGTFVKRQDRQGCCSKDPCGNAYTKMFRAARTRNIAMQKAPYVHQSDLIMGGW